MSSNGEQGSDWFIRFLHTFLTFTYLILNMHENAKGQITGGML